jgi:hypothetical protein
MPRKPKLPKTVRTLAAIASLIRDHFKMSCDKMKIKNWQTRVAPPFPYARVNNEFDVQECFEWVKRFKARKGETSQTDLNLESLDIRADEARSRKHIIEAEDKQFDFDLKKGKYIDRDKAYQNYVAGLQKLFLFFRLEAEKRYVESRREKLREIGVDENKLSEFFVWDKQKQIELIDAVAQRCDEEAKSEDAITI